jgi:hypothetical protein
MGGGGLSLLESGPRMEGCLFWDEAEWMAGNDCLLCLDATIPDVSSKMAQSPLM